MIFGRISKDKEAIANRTLGPGLYTLEEIAEIVGVFRSIVQDWIMRFKQGGLQAILVRPKALGKPSRLREPSLQQEMTDLLRQGKWRTARQAQRWLEQTHGIKIAVSTLYGWMGKLGGALKVPRPVNIKNHLESLSSLPSPNASK